MIRSDRDAINKACEAFQRSVLALNLKNAEDRARAWPGTHHMEAAVDAYLVATIPQAAARLRVGEGTSISLPAPTMANNDDILSAIERLRAYIEKVVEQSGIYRRAQLLTKLASNLYFDIADFRLRERFPE